MKHPEGSPAVDDTPRYAEDSARVWSGAKAAREYTQARRFPVWHTFGRNNAKFVQYTSGCALFASVDSQAPLA